MSERKSIIRETAPRYRRSSKKQKSNILDEFTQITGLKRKYSGWILRNWGKRYTMLIDGELIEAVVGTPRKRKRKPRAATYDAQLIKKLKKIWYLFDCPCGKRLVPILRNMLPVLQRFGEIELDPDTQTKLQSISAATIDRVLQKEKKKFHLKGLSHTKPASLFKHQIPVRTFGDWDEPKPGYVELDLVGHEGGNSRGEFAFTLNLTDVHTGWVEPRAIKNKAQKWTFQAILQVRKRLPFPLLGIHTDNGSEFINSHLLRYSRQDNILFTRSRPSRKNDNCFIEQKNNIVVRRYAGYLRYDTEEELSLLNELYDSVRLFVNFFQPSVKLINKTRQGSKVHRIYDDPLSPYQRTLASEHVSHMVKEKLSIQFQTLNPAELHRRINRVQQKLFRIAERKQHNRQKAVS